MNFQTTWKQKRSSEICQVVQTVEMLFLTQILIYFVLFPSVAYSESNMKKPFPSLITTNPVIRHHHNYNNTHYLSFSFPHTHAAETIVNVSPHNLFFSLYSFRGSLVNQHHVCFPIDFYNRIVFCFVF